MRIYVCVSRNVSFVALQRRPLCYPKEASQALSAAPSPQAKTMSEGHRTLCPKEDLSGLSGMLIPCG